MKTWIIAMVAALGLIAQPALAADASIGVVNVAKIMQDSKAVVSIRTQVQAKQKTFQTELDAKEKELQAEDQGLVKEKDKTDKAAFEKKVKAFREKAAAAQRQVQERKASLDKSFATALEEVQKSLVEITKQICAEKKYTMVISSQQVLYGDPELDITDEVMKRLDAKLPSVTVKF